MKNYYRVFLYPQYATSAIKEVATMLCEYNTAKVQPDIDRVFKTISNAVNYNVPLDYFEATMPNSHSICIDVKNSDGKWHTALYAELITIAELEPEKLY